MPDANAHPADMFTVTPDTLPRFWWLNPWLTAKRLHTACVALREYSDAQAASITQLHKADWDAAEKFALLEKQFYAVCAQRDALEEAKKNEADRWSKYEGVGTSFYTYDPADAQASRQDDKVTTYRVDGKPVSKEQYDISVLKAEVELIVKSLDSCTDRLCRLEHPVKAKKKKGRRHA